MTDSQRLGVGLVGCGGFGRFVMAAVADLPGVEPRFVTDADPSHAVATAKASGAAVVPNLDSLLAKPTVDLVIIATPPASHGPMALAAANAGKHVFCEKPLAISAHEASAVIEAAGRSIVQVTVDYVMRWNPLYWLIRRLQALRRADDRPVLGNLRRYALENLAGDSRLPADHWFWDRPTSGGIFIEHGVHFFDAAAWLLGERPVSVVALQTTRTSGEIDAVIASAIHPGGATATYAHSFSHPDGAEYQSVLLDWGFAHGTLRGWMPVDLDLDVWTDEDGAAAIVAALDDHKQALAVPGLQASGMERIEVEITQLEASNSQPWHSRGEIRPVARRLRLRATLGGEEAKARVYRECVRAGFSDLVDAIRSGRRPTVSGAEAYESLTTAVAAQEAADSGHMQELNQLHLTGVA
jgi:predicted dehydrogenase